ncbi:MAG TPA: BON domain-containing protein [Ramlibacter sp.]|jgi:osmotically-inducible protein OsmY|nr:BON domain-containing protein [Ramlibacter sp.]
MESMQRARLVLAASLALLLALGGCNRPADGMAGRRADTGARTSQRADVQHALEARDSGTSAAAASPSPDNTQAMGASGREKIDDGTITAQVNARLAQDKELSGIKIDVDTQNGVVTLSGPTPTASAKERAAEIAHHVKGVVSVNNQLTITSG